MRQLIASFDSFGVPLTLKLQSKQLLYKSCFGGLLSLVIYSLSLLYFTYVLHQWHYDKIPPKRFSSRTISNFENLNLDQDLIDINSPAAGSQSFIDPLALQDNIIIPILSTRFLNGTLDIRSLLDQEKFPYVKQYGRRLQLNLGINKFYENGSTIDATYKTLLFIKCNKSYLIGNQTCAPEDKIRQYFAQSRNKFTVQLTQSVLDADNNPVTNTAESYFFIEEQFSYSLNMNLKTNIYAINKNLISTAYSHVEYISDSTFNGQTNSIKFGSNPIMGFTTYASIFIQLQAQQTQVTIQYPQMGELLASIGSILSILFLFKYMIYSLNTSLLQSQILEEIITYYYPQFKNINIKYNLLRQMKSVTYKDEILNLDQFKESYQKLRHKAEMKITFNNIIYEQSRLYMALRSIKNQAELSKCHDYGIQLGSSIQSSPYQTYRDSKDLSYINSLILNDNDFDLISLEAKNKLVEIINDEPPISNDTIYRSNLMK